MRVYLETVRTINRRGRPGIKQQWVAEKPGEQIGPISIQPSIGRGRTRRDAIANLGPRPWDLDFDSILWKARYVFGLSGSVLVPMEVG